MEPQPAGAWLFRVRERGGEERAYLVPAPEHVHYLDLFQALAADLGLRTPLARTPMALPPPDPVLEPLLTEPLSDAILYGYGDPSVTRVEQPDGEATWWLTVTSNDAPDVFPLLRSPDLLRWEAAGFVFPRGRTPEWALTAENVADFWAPEMHRVGDAYWLCFAARARDHALAIGLATAAAPEGPYTAGPEPLVAGGVIDPHILIGPDGTPILLWKVDDNDKWPPRLAELLHRRPELIATLFPDPTNQRTVCLLQALWPWIRTREPMEQFFLNQPMIEAVTADFAPFTARLGTVADPAVEGVVSTLSTRIYAQPIAPDGKRLVGAPQLILENDLPWEAHLIEGLWAVEEGGRYYLFYAGNDFSTPHYGVGVAVADQPFGPYRKLAEPLLRSTTAWWGPGHPSAAVGPDGRRRLFLHAFFPGRAGYKAFRALLATVVRFEGDRVLLERP